VRFVRPDAGWGEIFGAGGLGAKIRTEAVAQAEVQLEAARDGQLRWWLSGCSIWINGAFGRSPMTLPN